MLQNLRARNAVCVCCGAAHRRPGGGPYGSPARRRQKGMRLQAAGRPCSKQVLHIYLPGPFNSKSNMNISSDLECFRPGDPGRKLLVQTLTFFPATFRAPQFHCSTPLWPYRSDV